MLVPISLPAGLVGQSGCWTGPSASHSQSNNPRATMAVAVGSSVAVQQAQPAVGSSARRAAIARAALLKRPAVAGECPQFMRGPAGSTLIAWAQFWLGDFEPAPLLPWCSARGAAQPGGKRRPEAGDDDVGGPAGGAGRGDGAGPHRLPHGCVGGRGRRLWRRAGLSLRLCDNG